MIAPTFTKFASELLVLGLMLAFHVDAFSQGWFHAKLALVVALTGYQGWLGAYGKRLASGKRSASDTGLRVMNEVPGIAGNQSSGEMVGATGFEITDMTGGRAHNCTTGTGCNVAADCASGTCNSTTHTCN